MAEKISTIFALSRMEHPPLFRGEIIAYPLPLWKDKIRFFAPLCRIFPGLVRDFPAGMAYAVFLQFRVLNLIVYASARLATIWAKNAGGVYPHHTV